MAQTSHCGILKVWSARKSRHSRNDSVGIMEMAWWLEERVLILVKVTPVSGSHVSK